MNVRSTLFAAAALAAAFTSVTAAVGPAVAQDMASVPVVYEDLNLRSSLGQAVLDRRIATAARTACGPEVKHLMLSASAQDCVEATIAAARPSRDALVGGQRLASLIVSRAAP